MIGTYKLSEHSDQFNGTNEIKIHESCGEFYIQFCKGSHILHELAFRNYFASYILRPDKSHIRFFKTYEADKVVKCAISIAIRPRKIVIKTFYDYKFVGALGEVWFAKKKESFNFAKVK